jgi:hypothetical protein
MENLYHEQLFYHMLSCHHLHFKRLLMISVSLFPNCNLSSVDFFLLALHLFSSLFHSITLNNQPLRNIESFYAKFANLKLNIHFMQESS